MTADEVEEEFGFTENTRIETVYDLLCRHLYRGTSVQDLTRHLTFSQASDLAQSFSKNALSALSEAGMIDVPDTDDWSWLLDTDSPRRSGMTSDPTQDELLNKISEWAEIMVKEELQDWGISSS